MQTIVNLEDLNQSDISLAGGKAANLGELLHAGMPVPPGFCITTMAYHQYLEVNHLTVLIRQQLAQLNGANVADLERVSASIREAFAAGQIPVELTHEITSAYRRMCHSAPAAVAVRSSATAEDLPDLSFAGQQDTFLNIIGEAALLEAVVRCWSSLWTPRAIGYRMRNGIDQQDIALAVVVQQMVASHTAGVMFTANPLTGRRAETVIDAAFGLGETVVSGLVEPDQYIVDTLSEENGFAILSKKLGSKTTSVRGCTEGGTRTSAEQKSDTQALTDEQILALAQAGKKTEAYFGHPQDIEWAWADDWLYLLQSRAITSLYPLPEGMRPRPLEVCFSFAAWQGMLEPYSPLGQDVFASLVVGFGRLFGAQITLETQNVFKRSAMRLFVNITGLLRQPFSRKVVTTFIGAVDPACSTILQSLDQNPAWFGPSTKMGLKSRWILLRGFLPVILRVFYNLARPRNGRERLSAAIERFVGETRRKSEQVNDLKGLIALLEEITAMGPSILLPNLLPGIIAGLAPYQVLIRLTKALPDSLELTYDLARGLPHNVTTEMDLALWSASCAIREDEPSERQFMETDAPALAEKYLQNTLPPAAQQALGGFLSRFGARGVGEIDFYRKRWHEDPTHIMQVIKNYLLIDVGKANPERIFNEGKEKARQARQQLQDAFKAQRKPLKAWLTGFLAERYFEMGGLRETPKFTIIRFLDMLRQGLLRTGQKLVEEGQLDEKDDLFFLYMDELRRLADGELPDMKRLIRERRAEYQKEQKRKRLPRVLLSDGTTFYEGLDETIIGEENTLGGAPVSAGVAEGIVHVVFDPHKESLKPGEILVCPGTDPAWTPLFLSAGGLVMEVGGMMTHGSVVAREYGIPAVVGVAQATSRLKNGQLIRVDGLNGRIYILDEAVPEPAAV